MGPEPRNEEALYHAAVSRPAAERSAYLRTACGADRELRERVEALLEIREAEDNFLAAPPFLDALGAPLWGVALDGKPIGSLAIPEGPGTVVGRYQLLEKIGEGGMAVVYMAEQQEPIRRKVALKIIKLGMDTRQVIARFEAERQALALMDH
ncbi:MAG: serine/threonine protein kinase, partial [Planctomycetes bacterium]|nr:serine/threonine protein kinase [Planctomycetota bacterium]